MRLILSEGKHALSALQGFFDSAFQCTILHNASPPWYDRERKEGRKLFELATSSGQKLYLQSIGGKRELWKAAKLYALHPVPELEILGLCFDPDLQSETDWRNSIQGLLSNNTSVFTWRIENGDYMLEYRNGNVLKIVPLPWDTPAINGFWDLPQSKSLYSTVVACLTNAFPDRKELAKRWFQESRASKKWKTVSWFWMAGWYSDAECDNFFREVLRTVEVHKIIEQSAETSPLWTKMKLLAS